MFKRKELQELGFDNEDTRAVLTALRAGEDDFEASGYRFISEAVIDEILTDELEAGPYILGCFTAWAIADATGWPVVLIEAAQKGEAYQEIGEGMTREQVERLGQILVRYDGYGHHFSPYDSYTNELTFSCSCCDSSQWRRFYAFRID